MITKCQWLLKFILPASGRLDKFYIIVYIFLYIMIIKDQRFLKIVLPALDKLDFYGIHCQFSIVVTPLGVG